MNKQEDKNNIKTSTQEHQHKNITEGKRVQHLKRLKTITCCLCSEYMYFWWISSLKMSSYSTLTLVLAKCTKILFPTLQYVFIRVHNYSKSEECVQPLYFWMSDMEQLRWVGVIQIKVGIKFSSLLFCMHANTTLF